MRERFEHQIFYLEYQIKLLQIYGDMIDRQIVLNENRCQANKDDEKTMKLSLNQ